MVAINSTSRWIEDVLWWKNRSDTPFSTAEPWTIFDLQGFVHWFKEYECIYRYTHTYIYIYIIYIHIIRYIYIYTHRRLVILWLKDSLPKTKKPYHRMHIMMRTQSEVRGQTRHTWDMNFKLRWIGWVGEFQGWGLGFRVILCRWLLTTFL